MSILYTGGVENIFDSRLRCQVLRSKLCKVDEMLSTFQSVANLMNSTIKEHKFSAPKLKERSAIFYVSDHI